MIAQRFSLALERRVLALLREGRSLPNVCEILAVTEDDVAAWRMEHSHFREALEQIQAAQLRRVAPEYAPCCPDCAGRDKRWSGCRNGRCRCHRAVA